ncbi:hypothetical protein K469DRAFT_139749 [Zopfia rhizophila CBS 207.26]|uniref:DUF7703 domain-containing protein n=1 Tax=Zopfia rhizophila CBS 207.26 TaxID=1314779 RepID=A0A6A6E8N6_9PEZI|nr:hypothetical protein K469DRAFT_139749 [Zopfia rhizophila CBS 207.26]
MGQSLIDGVLPTKNHHLSLYIFETRKHLKSNVMLSFDGQTNRGVFRHPIYTNIPVIFLDCSLLALSYADFFYIQSAYKPCVYGAKLRVEFAILNRLISRKSSSHPSIPTATGPATRSQTPARSPTTFVLRHLAAGVRGVECRLWMGKPKYIPGRTQTFSRMQVKASCRLPKFWCSLLVKRHLYCQVLVELDLS